MIPSHVRPPKFVELITDSEELQSQFHKSFGGKGVITINNLEFVCTSHNGDKKFGLQELRRVSTKKPEPIASEFTGEGLPPIGAVCETWFYVKGEGLQWVRVRALAPHPEDAKCMAVMDGAGDLAWANKFRPVRTPEQIAAEERKKAISEMVYGGCGVDQSDGTTTAFVICGLLYDAGYRKQAKD